MFLDQENSDTDKKNSIFYTPPPLTRRKLRYLIFLKKLIIEQEISWFLDNDKTKSCCSCSYSVV